MIPKSVFQRKELDLLIDELTKEHPDFQVVKEKMDTLKLKYSSDPIECMNTVLMALHPTEQGPEL